MRDLHNGSAVALAEREGQLFGRSKLLARLAQFELPYREFSHVAEGKTADATRIRGHKLSEAAKSLLVDLSFRRRERKFILAVVCGDEMLDFKRLAASVGARKARLSSSQHVARLTGCEIGAVVPVSFSDEFKVIADHRLFDQKKLVFNSGVLDRSLEIEPRHYFKLASPIVERIGREFSPIKEIKGA